VRKIQKRGLPEKFVGLIDVDDDLMAVIGEAGDLDLPVDHEINARRRLVLIVDHLPFAVLDDARARQMG
jgi:hypothetical protein